MAHEAYSYVAIVVPMTTLTVANEIAIVNIPMAATIQYISGSLRAMVSGTQTITIKNDGGTTLGSVSWSAAGASTGTVNSASINANDNIHFNITSLGVSVTDCAVTVWLRVASLP